MKNSEQPIYPQSENWQNDMEKHTSMPEKYSSPSMYGIGLTKREYFAALAMQGLLANSSNSIYPTEVAQDSLIYADALLAELEKTNSND
jgi:hypothetical protein